MRRVPHPAVFEVGNDPTRGIKAEGAPSAKKNRVATLDKVEWAQGVGLTCSRRTASLFDASNRATVGTEDNGAPGAGLGILSAADPKPRNVG
jgi:hypothetical protein